MKKLPLLCAFITLPFLTIQGQEFLKEFGKIAKDEFELKQYPLDKDAEAVVLFDIAKSYFVRNEGSFDVVFERSTRIKVLSGAGIKWGEVEIPFYQEGDIHELIYDLEAYAYNFENGRTTKTRFEVSNTYDEKINSYWKVKKFAIPNVKEGSVIEYRYKIKSQYTFNLRDWEFQWKIPVVYSEYEVKMIPFYEYTWLLQGANKFDSYTSYKDKGLSRQYGSLTFKDLVHKYIMKNVPAFNSEEFISSINDYIIKIDFQLSKINYPDGGAQSIITTWEDMIKELLKHQDFGKYVKKSEKLGAKLIGEEVSSLSSEKEKFNHVLDYVKSNFNWDGHNGKYATKTPNKLLDEKHGNCTDLNLLAVGLLNAAGIEAYPVLISTRNHGKIKYDYPYAHFFNYTLILAMVDGKIQLSDATEVLNLNSRIPPRCINDKGLIIQKDKVGWVGLECLFYSKERTDINIEIPSGETMDTRVSITANGYDALYYRKHYTGDRETLKKKLEDPDFEIIDSSVKVQHRLIKEKPYVLTYQQTSKPEIVDGKIYISPFLKETLSDNPLKQKTRTYPIDITYPKKRTFYATLKIPEGYQADYLPSEQKIKNQSFELTYNVTHEGNKITVMLAYAFKKSVYPASDYANMKFYFHEIVRKGNEKIVLSPIATNSD